MGERRGAWAGRLVGGLVLVVVLAACGFAGPGEVGNSESCPHRNAYCPAEGPGVAWPDRPATAPSGRYQLRVFAGASEADGDWCFDVVDLTAEAPPDTSGAVVLGPICRLDGGLGLVVAWDPREPATVWATRPTALRWRPNPTPPGGWLKESPGPGEVLPPVVTDTIASDTD